MFDRQLSVAEISAWLRETDRDRLRELAEAADRTRRERVGDSVWLRGLVELSSYCRRNCLYCGIRASRRIERYRMAREEIVDAAALADKFRFGSVVLQAAEDLALDESFIVDVVQEIRARFDLAITLSLGERDDREWIRWKEAGADRYLLRFETSDPELYRAIHPRASDSAAFFDRIAALKRLREIGYEIGSGVMIGVPGQTYEVLARDIALFRELDLDMIGCGPFLPSASTPLGRLEKIDGRWRSKPSSELEIPLATNRSFDFPASDDQVPNTNALAFKVVALTRLVCPDANIPSTTAVATLDAQGGRRGALQSGANVIMPNLTPQKYRRLYEIYPNKAATYEEAQKTRDEALKQLEEIGRPQGIGRGASVNFARKRGAKNAR